MNENEEYLNTREKSWQKDALFEVSRTKRSPQVLFDLNQGVFKIAGVSNPYDVNEFYFPLMRKIDSYLYDPCNITYLKFNLDYIDFYSSQFILAIIYRLKKVLSSNKKIKVEWFYKEENRDMMEVGETYAELSGLDFVFKPVKEKE